MKKFSVIFIFSLLLVACAPNRYYASFHNPYSLGLRIQSDGAEYFKDFEQPFTNVTILLINQSEHPYTLPVTLDNQLRIAGFSRFYKKAGYQPLSKNLFTVPAGTVLAPGDSIILTTLTIDTVLGIKNALPWFKDETSGKPGLSPAYETNKKAYPYCRIQAQYKAGDRWIISDELNITVGNPVFNIAKTKKINLDFSLSGQDEVFYTQKPNHGEINCKVTNKTDYPIKLFSDPGSIRFNLYGYSGNRTAVMKLEHKIVDNKLMLPPVTVPSGKTSSVFKANLKDLLYHDEGNYPWYWSWNKKNPPISPVVYNNGKWTHEIELWFGVVVDGKEYLSNPIILPVSHDKK